MFLSYLLSRLIDVYIVLILLRALSTWLQLDARNTLVRLLCQITDPFLGMIRRFVPPLGGAIDISPAIAIFGLAVVKVLLGGGF